ncbi:MBG domain-containing protein, partial [uncultured Fibrobacter sp.]|uniref:MBG domain-containing protein n=1 Tax=uncultured Fibrobacter sp. TaxID=261512 RepID=UPI002630835C
NGGVTISGGSVTATGNYNGIYNDKGNITLGWTNSTDFIKVSSIHLGVDSCTVSIAEGKSFKDEKGNVYSGPLTGEQLSAIEGKKLEPCYAVALDLQDGKAPVMLPATFDENGVAHVEKPADPIRSGFTFEGWFTATDGDTEFDFSAAITGNTTAYAHWTENTPVEYIDENGKTKTVTDYTVLTSSTNVSNLPGGWYVVQGEVKYTSQVKFSGDAHLILADGAEMEIKTEGKYGIDASNNLTIYGQNEQSGILNDTANGTNGIGIFSWSDITISGGKVTATGKNGYGIYGYDGVTISGGSVEATSTYGIYSKETVTISGGKVTASGDNSGINTNAGHITLGWTNSTDFIKVSSIYLGADSCTVSIAEGKSFVDENGNEYRGTLTDENLESIKNKTLTPLMPFPDNIVIANISGATYTGDSIRLEPVVTIGENVLELGKDYTLAYKDNLNASDTAKVIVKGAGKYYGEVQKLFTIDKAPLKITALNDTIVYGDEPASAGVAYEGFVGNETSEVLKGELALEIGYKQYDDVGQYAITPSGLKADNYEIDSVAGTLTVEPKVISIVWGEQTVFAYDGKEHVPTVTAEGFVEGHVARLVVTGAAVEVGNDTAKVALDENDANSKNYKLRTTELEKEFKIVMPIAYIDENGVEQTVTDYTVLTENTSVDNLDGGWYVVEGEVKYTSQVKFSGDAHLILADGATMEIETKGVSEHGIYASNNLTIYGQSKQSDQSDQSGTLKVSATGSGIYSRGNITIIGGSVTATSEYGYGIYSGNITLGWTNSTDYIYASGYYSENGISIAEGKSLRTDEKMLTGMVINNDDINGKTLVPSSFDGKFLSNASIAVADIPVQKYADGKPVCPSVLVTDGKDTLNAGTDYTVTCFNNTAVSSATLDEAAIAQITGKGNYAGAIQKRFFIWNNIRDYAAVQVFEDADGKTHAEIDGAYDGADAVAIDEDVENVAVKFNREFTPNSGFSTIMLPFDIEAKNLTGVKSVIEFAGVVDNNGKNAVGMTYVWCNATLGEEELEKGHTNCNGLQGELKAYTPYMIEMESATLGINGGVTLKATVTPEARVDDWVFRGTLAMHEWTSEEMKNTKIWGFAAQQQGDFKIGEFVPFGAGAWILPFRAFMEYDPDGNKGSSGAPVPKGELGPTVASIDLPETMEVVIVSREGGEEHTTVIGRLNTRTGEIRLNNVGRRTFDLKGRSVGKPKAKGIYLKK